MKEGKTDLKREKDKLQLIKKTLVPNLVIHSLASY